MQRVGVSIMPVRAIQTEMAQGRLAAIPISGTLVCSVRSASFTARRSGSAAPPRRFWRCCRRIPRRCSSESSSPFRRTGSCARVNPLANPDPVRALDGAVRAIAAADVRASSPSMRQEVLAPHRELAVAFGIRQVAQHVGHRQPLRTHAAARSAHAAIARAQEIELGAQHLIVVGREGLVMALHVLVQLVEVDHAGDQWYPRACS